jgi:replicative DNA helicase
MHSIDETEKSVISAIITQGSEAFLEVDDLISSDSFSDDRHGIFYTVFSHIYNSTNPPKKVGWGEFLGAAEQLGLAPEVKDNKNYLAELKHNPCQLDNLRRYAGTLFKNQAKQELRAKAELAIRNLDAIDVSESLDKIISTVETPIFEYIASLNTSSQNIKKLSDGAREYIYDLLGNPRQNLGVPSFIPQWNEAVGGGYRPGFHLISASSKVGKSSYSIADCKYIGGLQIPCLYLDREMVIQVAQTRTIASISKVGTLDIEHGRINPGSIEHGKLLKALNELEELPLYYSNIAALSIDEVISLCRRWLVRYVGYGDNGKINPCLIILDYVKVSNSAEITKNTQEYQAVGFFAQKLADFGVSYDTTISAFCQSNRQNDVSMSDRLKHSCNSLSYLEKPDDDALIANTHLGNRLLRIDRTRYGPGLAPNDYIALKLEGRCTDFQVLGLASKLGANPVPTNAPVADSVDF